MRIGELSRRTRIPIRMLRYYEERGLLTPQRTPSGYRLYQESDVGQAALVSSLVRAGLPTRLIMPLLDDLRPKPPAADEPGDRDELIALFAAELARLDRQVACLSLSRDAVRQHLRRLRAAREPGCARSRTGSDSGAGRAVSGPG
ncbi:MerR family DNA-binding transcriptional regulator [Micromonospora sp. PLK6-60]|uniref:MerR family DNA-binding transcriptional regulator n=1 Tax=Micromonospora sp. PLK6-60 TaxID=2873383 RepID=UPI001CA61721|nr:MerR family DNA-binding transcriptional regulator [Micromonospora sp. PLK6-60]MBY8871017.1 MerR family DNA-binding transcriptional regulator [Micromonospora sp. PLK6-60]